MWPAIISAVGAIGGALISNSGSKSSANTAAQQSDRAAEIQAQSVRETNAQNYNIFKENQWWNTTQANMAHRNEITDLVSAGLNPILTATGGNGAAVPSSPLPTMQAPYEGLTGNVNSANQIAQGYRAQQNAAMIEGIKSSLDLAAKKVEIDRQKAEIERTKQDQKTSKALEGKTDTEAAKTYGDILMQPTIQANLTTDGVNKRLESANIVESVNQKASQTQLNSASSIAQRALAAKHGAEISDLKAEMFAKENERKARHNTGYVTPYLNAAGDIINSATKLNPKNQIKRRPNYVTP